MSQIIRICVKIQIALSFVFQIKTLTNKTINIYFNYLRTIKQCFVQMGLEELPFIYLNLGAYRLKSSFLFKLKT